MVAERRRANASEAQCAQPDTSTCRHANPYARRIAHHCGHSNSHTHTLAHGHAHTLSNQTAHGHADDADQHPDSDGNQANLDRHQDAQAARSEINVDTDRDQDTLHGHDADGSSVTNLDRDANGNTNPDRDANTHQDPHAGIDRNIDGVSARLG